MLPRWYRARTVMVCSPKREVYKEWTKGSDIQLIMPLWEWYEMEKLVEQLYRGKVRAILQVSCFYSNLRYFATHLMLSSGGFEAST